ncbi:MAG: ATP/GTP-binding protein [Theionarchaea archaeon]|nr:ATP/GTP-binding protein [Theionarchaea archaeon]MBU6999287.1 ATP/GTP-binding protein [Theionarchaea archaeon]MBU7019588.1 ATP/GTP-binding protein [Theionarchaea archaeon]MBU7033767.1 ATP/GTP-binding protein [Theionarchaea archaeon]MBU7039423.1 ATP/GTP-binding protein [Theionarchaea archaeon]
MMKAKILVTGAFNAGKTTFIHSISEIQPVYTDKKMLDTEELTTVAMDFGRITIDDDLALYLFGTPGQERFDFMWEILKEDIIGFILLVDSVTPEIPTARKILDFLVSHSDVPFVIACTKRDHIHALPMETLSQQMRLDDVPVIPCVATERDSVKEVLLILLREILDRLS